MVKVAPEVKQYIDQLKAKHTAEVDQLHARIETLQNEVSQLETDKHNMPDCVRIVIEKPLELGLNFGFGFCLGSVVFVAAGVAVLIFLIGAYAAG